jgi:hypothetical protein
MTRLARWIQGIHMQCTKCSSIREGVIMLHTDDETGLTVGISVECSRCHKVMMNWGIVNVL